jgi:glyoxylase I family protein
MEKIKFSIDHPAIFVLDPEKIAEWYCNVFDYSKFSGEKEKNWIIKGADGTFIEIMKYGSIEERKNGIGWAHLAFRVKDLDEAIIELDRKKVKWIGGISAAAGGGRVRSFMDPEGNMVQIVER